MAENKKTTLEVYTHFIQVYKDKYPKSSGLLRKKIKIVTYTVSESFVFLEVRPILGK